MKKFQTSSIIMRERERVVIELSILKCVILRIWEREVVDYLSLEWLKVKIFKFEALLPCIYNLPRVNGITTKIYFWESMEIIATKQLRHMAIPFLVEFCRHLSNFPKAKTLISAFKEVDRCNIWPYHFMATRYFHLNLPLNMAVHITVHVV